MALQYRVFRFLLQCSGNKYSYQEKLKSIKVSVLGLGGVGSNILYNLVALGVYNIRVIDFDEVELSNLNRQIIYNESDIGKLKTNAAQKRILDFFPKANIEFVNTKISCSNDVEKIISGTEIVIAAIDIPRDKIMDWVNLACVNQNIPFLCGSLDSKIAMYYAIVPYKSGCIECWKTALRNLLFFYFKNLFNIKNLYRHRFKMLPLCPLSQYFQAY